MVKAENLLCLQWKACAKFCDPVENTFWVRPEGDGPALPKILGLFTRGTKITDDMIMSVVRKENFLTWCTVC